MLIVPTSTHLKELTEALQGKFWMSLMGVCNHEVALRDPMRCNAFFNTCSPEPVGHRSALTQQSVDPECWLLPMAETKRPLLHARDILCASVKVHFQPKHIHD